MKKVLFNLSMLFIMLVSLNVNAQTPNNKANQFDYAGRIHNEVLEKYISEHGDKSHNANEICQIIESYALQNSELVKMGETDVDCSLVKQGVADFSNQFRNVIKSSKLSTNAKAKAQELIDYMFFLAFKEANTEYSEFYNFIVKYENEIINSSSFSSKDKKMLLHGSSIARYSALFWKEHFNEIVFKTSKNDLKTSSFVKKKWWQWAIIGVSDVAGGILGTIGTGISASGLANTLIKEAK